MNIHTLHSLLQNTYLGFKADTKGPWCWTKRIEVRTVSGAVSQRHPYCMLLLFMLWFICGHLDEGAGWLAFPSSPHYASGANVGSAAAY
jgi:hypothetical protein